jgi:hypothetical protein
MKVAVYFTTCAAFFLGFFGVGPWGLPNAFADIFNTETSSSVHALGMGGTGVNTERGPYALFYNPANLAAKDTGTNIQVVNVQFDGAEGLMGQVKDAKAISFGDLQKLYPYLNANKNTAVGARYSLYPNITLRNFSVGFLYERNRAAEVRAADDALHLMGRDRMGPTAALSYRLFGGIFRLGASAQFLTVGDMNSIVKPPITVGTLDYNTYEDAGSGLVLTGGATLTLPFAYLPSFSVVARNLGDSKFSAPPVANFGVGRSVPIQYMTFDFGTSMTIYLAKRAELKLAFDYHDLTNRLAGTRFRHVFAGTEIIFFDLLKLRAGLMHGYPTFGLGFTPKKASLELAVYSEEKDDKLRGSAEARYVLQYTYSILK